MAVTRRRFFSLLSGIAATISCAPGVGPFQAAVPKLWQRPGAPGSPTVLVLMPETPHTHAVWEGLCDEVGGEFTLVAVGVETRDSDWVIGEAIRRVRPAALVLMNNPTVAAYRRYVATPGAERALPVVVLLASFLDADQLALLGATGIAYEVPLITAATNLRRVVAAPVDRIGVVYRRPLAHFVSHHKHLARREQIQVVDAVVGADPNASELKRAIRLAKQHSDALWILNDDRLLTPQLIANGWLPGLNERPWNPTIVGAASLVTADHSFGTFAVLPDHTALGTQAASLLFDIRDAGWALPERSAAHLPLSTTTTMDVGQARERFALKRDALARVDRLIE